MTASARLWQAAVKAASQLTLDQDREERVHSRAGIAMPSLGHVLTHYAHCELTATKLGNQPGLDPGELCLNGVGPH
jgi:hypothetical protein